MGAKVELKSDQGEMRKFRITQIENGRLTLDGNHPLTGKEVTFPIEVIYVRDATDNEIKQSHGIDSSTILF